MNDDRTHAAKVAAVIQFMKDRMPSIDDLIALEDPGAGCLGPEVMLPAIYLHILIGEIELVILERESAQLGAKAAAFDLWAAAVLQQPKGTA